VTPWGIAIFSAAVTLTPMGLVVMWKVASILSHITTTQDFQNDRLDEHEDDIRDLQAREQAAGAPLALPPRDAPRRRQR
jgi:hypothetical protein